MSIRSVIVSTLLLGALQTSLSAQVFDSLIDLSGIVYDDQYRPVPASHVINLDTHQGAVTDSLGIFRMPVHFGDTLLIRNIAFHDTLVPVSGITVQRNILLRRKYYALQEAKIFEWGSTYEDFRSAIVEMPNQQTLGESMGLPVQDPDYVPYDMDEELLKSPGFLLTSPVSYFYHNFSKEARSARKVYWLEKNRELLERFEAIMASDNIESITDLSGTRLQDFLAFLNERLVCNFNCTEIQLYTEIYALWDVYRKLEKAD